MRLTRGQILFGLLLVLALLVFLLRPGGVGGGLLGVAATDGIVNVSSTDPEMLAAFEKAKATLDEFLALADAPPPNTSYFAVKVAVDDMRGREYFWIWPFERKGDRYSGLINNTPRVVSNVEEGDEIEFDRDQIADWTYENTVEGRTYGNFTLCAMLARSSEEERQAVLAESRVRCE